MKKLIGSFILWILGWKIILEGDTKTWNRCILVVAPHTVNIEYFLGNMVYWKFGKKLKVVIKDQHTKAWYGFVVKWLGAIGIDRSQKNNLIEFVANEFKKDDFSLVIAPEGTRKRVSKWRLGFYHMALAAKVPIVLAAADFPTKTIYIGKTISVHDIETRTKESILQELEDYYKKVTPKIPENWNPKIY